jgi:hypothetical protein
LESLALVQYSDGRFTPIVTAGADAPGGTWPGDVRVLTPASMNQRGNVVFTATVTPGANPDLGTFLWDAQARKVTAVALKGMPAGASRTFAQGGNISYAVINNRDEIAFSALVNNAAGQSQGGIFFRGQDGALLPIALPDQSLPDGGAILAARFPSLDDEGAVAFAAQRVGSAASSAYLWANGSTAPVLGVGQARPGGGKFAGIGFTQVNDQNASLLVETIIQGVADSSYYRWSDGNLAPVLEPGQEMPGGGTLRRLPSRAVSYPNEWGQYAFLAQLDDGSTAAYGMGADGQLSLILKSGATTDLGPITRVGPGSGDSLHVALNSKGQVALTVQVAGGPDTLVLLTPATP